MNYFDMWRDAWNFQKKYAEIQTNEEYWQAVTDEGNAICNKHNNCIFIRDLILAVITEFERVVKQDAETHAGI